MIDVEAVTVSRARPLCVEAAALSPANIAHEAALSLLRRSPWRLIQLPAWLLSTSYLRSQLDAHSRIDWELLPLNEAVVEHLRRQRATGRRIVLVSDLGAHLADGLARRLQLFDEVIAAERGAAPRDVTRSLLERFGVDGYELLGREQVTAAGTATFIRAAPPAKPPEAAPGRIKDLVLTLRAHQWLKNLLVFIPALAAHRADDAAVIRASLLAFLAFSFCASSVYILNDMLDLESDRRHPRKRKRPLASARVSIARGAALVPALLILAVLIAGRLPPMFMGLLAAYFFCTLMYSVLLKRQVIVDVMMLSGLYTIRVIAGALATLIQPSFWLLAFSMFIFLSLALVKRYAELNLTLKMSRNRAAGRGYTVEDLPVLLSLGAASGFVSVLIIALYINQPTLMVHYPSPIFLWGVPALLLYWIARLWMKTHRGEMHDDPIVFTVRDWQSLTVIALSAVCFGMAAKSGILVGMAAGQ